MAVYFRHILRHAAAAVAVLALSFCAFSCLEDKDFIIDNEPEAPASHEGGREETPELRRVLIFYEAGFNNLARYLYDDINKEMFSGWLPGNHRNDNVILVYSKLSMSMTDGNPSYEDYTPKKSYLTRIYRDDLTDKAVQDTIEVFDESHIASSSQTLNEVLSIARDRFPARGYGLLFSSHGSGWLPQDYYYDPWTFEKKHAGELTASAVEGMKRVRADIPSSRLEDDPYFGMTRSLGRDEESSGGVTPAKEMTTAELVAGIPFHLDYLLFDMCFSASVEVMYALKDKTSWIGASCAEVLANGLFDYSHITNFLLNGKEPDLPGLIKDGFAMYDGHSFGLEQSSTISLIRTDGMDSLAEVCRYLFEKYSSSLANLKYKNVQGYYRLDRHYFFDLEDVFVKCGASEEDLAMLREALGGCVTYCAATPWFMESFRIDTTCGLSIYLPAAGTRLLNKYYMEEAWNKDTGLVR